MTAERDPSIPLPCEVISVRKEIADTVTLELQPPEVSDASFEPGQFNMLYAFGAGDVPISISGVSKKGGRLLHTVRAVGPVTSILTKMKKGSRIGLRGPFGSSWPLKAMRNGDVIVAAGGLGLAPLRPALHALLSERERYRTVALLYGARSPSDILFRKEIERWRGRQEMFVDVTVDHSVGEWHGNVGVVTTLVERTHFEAANAAALICGPEVMMRFTVQSLLKRGLPENKIFVSMERNMKCAVGLCGHCQFGPLFICKNGPVFSYKEVAAWLGKKEL